ncbi:hypothetical protein C482_18202 [Natrialba chahannaoensis JCM 10990]|uniref:Uncharacterized protein n=1 Tax=Natrialba chahannaoensis JCM 10990 TaxID=1227492 RepID=M0A8P7_9EURY|nr:hypothetical protein C482_18202 [Natrialba chahannaoensis JCM 10990]
MATDDSPTTDPPAKIDGTSEDGSRDTDATNSKSETGGKDEVKTETEDTHTHTHNRETDEPQAPGPPLSEQELAALHEVELGLEWIQRAQGYLLEFHHATGHGIDHIDEAETHLRTAGHDDLAAAIRRDLLPHGVVDDDRWSYDVLEDFQATLLAETVALERRVRDELADGERHVAERRQEREWKYLADEER